MSRVKNQAILFLKYFQRESVNFLDCTIYGGYFHGPFHILWLNQNPELTFTDFKRNASP